jgi:hypothetical protein
MAGQKLQSAMEYLMTYGWAILILAIVASVLFAIGAFSPGNSASQVCQLEAGFVCSNYYMVQNGILSVNIYQTTTTPINITAIGCNTNSTYIPTNTIVPQAYLTIGGNKTINVQCYKGTSPFSGQVDELYVGYLQINYTDVTTGFPEVIYGTVAVKIAR